MGCAMTLRSTYSDPSGLQYRLRAASALLGITDNTTKRYLEESNIQVRRANDDGTKSVAVRLFDPDTLFQIAQWRREKNLLKTPQNGPYVITVDIVKGGTGKTTTAAEITLHLQLAGLRVLAIDLDVQANLTQYMGYEADLTEKDLASYGLNLDAIVGQTFAHVVCPFLNRAPGESVGSLIKMPFGKNGPHLIAADANLGDIEFALSTAKGSREMALDKLLNLAKTGQLPGFDTSKYDVIVFDCPPNVSMTSTAALAAADIVVAPVRLDAFAVKGLSRVIEELKLLRETYKDAIHSELVILATHFAAQLSRIQRMNQALQQYEKQVAPVSISVSEEFPKSLERYIPMSLQKPLSQASNEYKLFTDHLIKRLIAIEEKRSQPDQKGAPS
ncbi:partitioning protein [Acidovorax sp. NO-1]|nr:partitioning protein [Acidovorax sp. NO-1]